ncbi:diversity-generating retroelement protein bAvd family protein [Dysgonamonadaceae bacterium]|jgi:four helix bundle protein|nr:diversity-generating retroelement protein bAvd family protein [Dysgonamonadaceae bacterium]
MHNFKKLDIGNKSVAFVSDIYRLVNTFPQTERFGSVSQMQRAEVSIPTNIAEGSAKSSAKEFARFLEMSLGSSFELANRIMKVKLSK